MPIQRDSKGRFCSTGVRVEGRSSIARKSLHVAFVIDSSGSMFSYVAPLKAAYDKLLMGFEQDATNYGMDVVVSRIDVSTTARIAFRGLSPAHARGHHYTASGGTALLDGMGLAITCIEERLADSNLIMVLTDGEENESRLYTHYQIADMLKARQAAGNWTMAFQLPQGLADRFCRLYSVPRENAIEWEQTCEGFDRTMNHAVGRSATFIAAVNSGQMASSSFYVETDLSRLTQTQLKNNLQDVASRFKSITVEKECSVRSLVEVKTGKPYVLGSAFYQLMKKELVQPQKEVLIVEKGNKAIYGGIEARNLIGLPQGSKAKVIPGNHANYDIFVQSSSTNRILPRGTKVLIDVTRSIAATPTWETR